MTKTLDDAGLNLIFRTARTYNGYTDEPVAESDLRAIWDLMKMGPTSANTSPLRIVWVSDDAKEKLAAARLRHQRRQDPQGAGHRDHRHGHGIPRTAAQALPARRCAPVVRRQPGDASKPPRSAIHALQGAYFIIAARALGLDTGPMSGFDNAGVDAAFFAGHRR